MKIKMPTKSQPKISEIDKKVKMISSVSQALSFRKKNSNADNEEILKHISQFVKQEKDKQTKLLMIAASSKALQILDKAPFLTDREIIRKVMQDLPEILENTKG